MITCICFNERGEGTAKYFRGIIAFRAWVSTQSPHLAATLDWCFTVDEILETIKWEDKDIEVTES